MDLKALRSTLRQRRRSLSPQQQQHHARQAVRHALRSPWFRRHKRVGLFISNDGELETAPLMQALWHHGHRLFLPVLEHSLSHPMVFVEVKPDTPLRPNRYGIPEPIQKKFFPACLLDVVITPLVAFDANGSRLGMGGGFYDRTFTCKRNGRHKPLLIGWAHACQEVAHLPRQPWDVPLDGVITEAGARAYKVGCRNSR